MHLILIKPLFKYIAVLGVILWSNTISATFQPSFSGMDLEIPKVGRYQHLAQSQNNKAGNALKLIAGHSSVRSASLVYLCFHLHQKAADISYRNCLKSNLRPGHGRSISGIPIYSRFVLSEKELQEKRILFLGGVQGDEITSVTSVFEFMEFKELPLNKEITWINKGFSKMTGYPMSFSWVKNLSFYKDKKPAKLHWSTFKKN